MAGSQVSREISETVPSKSHAAYLWMKERILDGRFTPGYRLVFSQLAKELEMSVVPVREATRLLEANGLVTFEHNVGAQVAMVEPTEYVYTMQTLSIIEGAATALSAAHINTGDIRRARAVNARMVKCLGHFDPHRFTELNLEFHSILFDSCPNPHILDLVHRGWSRLKVLRDSIFSFVPGRSKQSVKEHEQLLGLIESNADPLKIEMAARTHRAATLDAFLAYQAKQHKNTSHTMHGATPRKVEIN